MATLNSNWLTEGWVDFEYKKYLLLAYLQDVSQQFDQRKLYPKLSELLEHHKNLRQFRDSKISVERDFPKEISKFDFEKFKIEYRQLADDELIQELDSVVEFALPEIENKLGLGKELYEEVETKLEIFPIGILPVRSDEGYFFLSDFLRKLVNVYYYQITIFENFHERFRGINAKFLFQYNISLSATYESVKNKLMNESSTLPNAATYAIEFKESFPLPETMLPVAKRSLVRRISIDGMG